ncbi:hypothetical protein HU727_019195 [Pseudomonas sp. SWRI153]|uniref:Uncharacterized protein n=1 Tax=Pseudomonas khorasanensis TaxID=2745508 RepID=A0A923F757_9PSED|nr:hypothetical protein [Pseudomonas khorasanensis]MBV4487715.1 hypothetical protein [Pseudomonas khorasanensis]
MHPAGLDFLLVKRIQRAVPYSARNIYAKMFQVLGIAGLAGDRGDQRKSLSLMAIRQSVTLRLTLKDESVHRKHTEKVRDAQ